VKEREGTYTQTTEEGKKEGQVIKREAPTDRHTYTHIHTYTHTYTHSERGELTYHNVDMYAYKCEYIYIHMYTNICEYICIYVRIYVYIEAIGVYKKIYN